MSLSPVVVPVDFTVYSLYPPLGRHATDLDLVVPSVISATSPILPQVPFSRPIKSSVDQRMLPGLWRVLAKHSCAIPPARRSMTTLLPSRPELERLIQNSTSSSASFQLVWSSNPSWPVPSDPSSSTSDPASTSNPDPASTSSLPSASPQSPVHLSVLDSSFNPPHLAHLGLALSHFPRPISSLSPPGSSTSTWTRSSSSDVGPKPLDHRDGELNDAPESSSSVGPGPYTSRLLLFSIRNADKTPSPGDATVLQRIEMTLLLAERAERDGPLPGGTAVALINEPTFVGKSRIIHSFLSNRQSHPNVESASSYSTTPSTTKPTPTAAALPPAPPITLSFLVGTDTLIRFFDPKYYSTGITTALSRFFAPPPEGEGSILISARRGVGGEGQAVELDVLAREEARGWVAAGGVRVMGSAGEGKEGISSTAIRRAIAGEEGDRDQAGEVGREEGRGEGVVRRLEGLVPREIAEYIAKEGLYRE